MTSPFIQTIGGEFDPLRVFANEADLPHNSNHSLRRRCRETLMGLIDFACRSGGPTDYTKVYNSQLTLRSPKFIYGDIETGATCSVWVSAHIPYNDAELGDPEGNLDIASAELNYGLHEDESHTLFDIWCHNGTYESVAGPKNIQELHLDYIQSLMRYMQATLAFSHYTIRPQDTES